MRNSSICKNVTTVPGLPYIGPINIYYVKSKYQTPET